MGGTLHLNISAGLRFALERYRFDVLLRMDDDSLVVGPRPEDDAISRFRDRPALGVLGSYHLTCQGYVRDLSWAATRLHEEMDEEKAALEAGDKAAREARLRLARTLRELYRDARAHGYVDGEHCLGAAVYFSYAALRAIGDSGMLDACQLQPSILGEDHLRGLVIRACGIETAEFEQGEDPLCLDWLQLPCAPERIVERGKKIIHTVKRWHDLDQGAIRAYFRRLRNRPGSDDPKHRLGFPDRT